jgi:predicted amidophosphoribosyltransferase
MDLGFCSQCKKNVPTDRPPFNVCLFCVLLFTGIGAVVYVIIWLVAMPKNRCTFCRNTTMPAIREGTTHALQAKADGQLSTQNRPPQIKETASPSTIESGANETPIFCPFCGSQLRSGATFCPECGGNVQERVS